MKKKPTFKDELTNKCKAVWQKQPLLVILFISITLLFWGLRLQNFDNMVTFHIDQGEHIRETREMVESGKPRLIGPLVTTRIRDGKSFFIGPHYYYILALLGVATGWSVLGITKALLFMWWASFLALVYWIGKKFSWQTAMIVYLILATHPYLVSYSRMFINPNFTFPFSLSFFYFLYQAWHQKTWKNWLLAGIFSGIAFSFHFVVAIWFLIIGLVWLGSLLRKKAQWWYLPLAAGGALLGDAPYVLFELRHNFYNLRTYLTIGAAPEGSGLTAGYYLFAYIPLIAFVLALGFEWLRKRTHLLVPLAIAIAGITYAQVTYTQPKVRGVGMPKGWSVPLQMELAQKVCADQQAHPEQSFEIAAMVTADLRALDWRFFIEDCGAKPAGFMEYPFVDVLYLIDQGFLVNGDAPGNWEIASMNPYVIEEQKQLNEYLWFYKLVRVKENIE